MVPLYHTILGLIFALFTLILFPQIGFLGFFLILFASIFIDFDHYLVYCLKKNNFSLKKAYHYYLGLHKLDLAERKKGIKRKSSLQIFHTLEFHFLVLIIGLYFTPFFYIFIGMLFHSIVDAFYLLKKGFFYKRQYFFVLWLWNKI